MSDSNEKRQDPRIPLETALSIQFEDLWHDSSSTSGNISFSGMFIRSPNPLPPGSQFSFSFQLSPSLPPVSGKAVVMWTREKDISPESPAGMGVKFIELDEHHRGSIVRIVNLEIEETE